MTGSRRPGRSNWIAALAAATTLLVPTLAAACAVCFGNEESDWTTAFTIGTVLIMALPPAIVVTACVTIRRAMKRREAYLETKEAEVRRRPQPAPSPQAAR